MVKGCFLVTNVPFFALSALLYGGMMMSQSQTQQAPFFQEALFSNAGRDDGNIIAASKKILEVCLDLSVSDVHLEPQKNGLRIRGRMDGVLQDLMRIPPVMQDALISRYKIMARMDIGEKRLPQDGRIQMTYQDRSIDIRVSSLPTLYGETLVMRLLDSGKGLYSLDHLGFSKENLERLYQLLHEPYGLILVTGPTGSGKSSTLYAILQALNESGRSLVTVEDPIEYQIDGISQVAVHPKIGLTFARCLRSILRQDPDLIVVGEIRDRETAEMSVHAALTGHLVFSTLHTNTAVGAVSRLLDLGVDSYLVASALKGIVAQRLLRRLCLQCRTAYAVGENSWERTYFSLKGPLHLFHASSCAHCRGTGYSGRLAVQEVFPFDEACRQAAARGLSEKALLELGRQQQVASLFEDGRAKVLAGETSPEEMLRVLGPLEKK